MYTCRCSWSIFSSSSLILTDLEQIPIIKNKSGKTDLPTEPFDQVRTHDCGGGGEWKGDYHYNTVHPPMHS